MATGEKSSRQQSKKVQGWKRWGLLLVVPLLSLVAIQPILTGILPWRGDGLLHLYRLAELERAVRAGVLFPRWSPDLGYGFGFPLFNYYAPFSYYIALIPRLLGFSLPVSLAVSYILSLWALGWGVWLWARDLWQSWLGAVTAVLAILYAPYILYNTYHRAALAELWGLAFLALTFWAVFRGWGLGARGWGSGIRGLGSGVIVAVFYALLILSHNITALIGTPLIIGYAIFLAVSYQPSAVSPQNPTHSSSLTPHHSFIPTTSSGQALHPSSFILLSLLLGLGLSAFFWLPAFFERSLVQIENLTATAAFSYLNHFLNFSDILALPITAVSNQVNPNIPRSLSWPVVILTLLGVGGWGLGAGGRGSGTGGKRPTQSSSLSPHHSFFLHPSSFFLLATVLCLFMVTPLSQPIWQAIDLLSFIQFPWRFLGPASLFLALLAALGAIKLHSQLKIHNSQFTIIYTIILTAIITLYALPWLFPSRANTLPTNIAPSDTAVFEADTGWLGTTAAADYLPRSVQSLPAPDGLTTHLDTTQFPNSFAIEDLQEAYTAVSLTYNAEEAVTAVFHIFHFPGWHATLDDSPIEITPSDPHGLITTNLPAGTHTLQLNFGSTTLRTVANIISLLSLILLIVLIYKERGSGIRGWGLGAGDQDPSFTIHNSQFTIHNYLPAILTILAIFLLKTAVLDHHNTPFRTTHHSVLIPQSSLLANFNNTIQLLAADLPTAPIPADQPIDLTLIWQALPPVADEYSISVQLIGENNIRYAQSDSFHPAGLPLPRWQAGEYGIDEHSLTALPGTPPGAYDLTVYVYNLASGQRLDTLNENGRPTANEYHLGTITLTTPTQFPDPAAITISSRTTEGGPLSYLLGYDQPLTNPTVGQTIPLTLYWHTPETPSADQTATVRLACNNENVTAVNLPNSPNTSWQAGEIQRLDTAVPIRPINENGTAVENGFCTLYLQLEANETSTETALETFPITAPDHTSELPQTAVPINQSLANQATLAAIQLDQTTVNPGDTLSLTLYWQPQALFNDDYKVFVQLLGADGRILTQQDQIPANGTRPTTGWIPDEIIRDEYRLGIPADAPAGTYQLITGLYHAQTGQRLTLADQSGDAITLPFPIEVKLAE